MSRIAAFKDRLGDVRPFESSGRVVAIRGSLIQARIPHATLGEIVSIDAPGRKLLAQVVAFNDDLFTLAPFDSSQGLAPGTMISSVIQSARSSEFENLIGHVLDATGIPIDCSGHDSHSIVESLPARSAIHTPPPALERTLIREPIQTGIRAIDGLCTIGYGQRIGLFAGPGTGKSTLLGMIARNVLSDVNVIAMIGERGREVKEFIVDSLGSEGLKRTIVVVSTSDESPLRRSLAANTATVIAEYFRDQGLRVMLLVDSITRMARALRDVGLDAGELPVRQGYPASVFTALPRLLERAGTNSRGSITAIYTVLTNNDDEPDPLADEIKSLLDGHIVMTSRLAQSGMRPAIDPTLSVSRLMPRLLERQQSHSIQQIMEAISRLKRDKDFLLLGGVPDCELLAAVRMEDEIQSFLRQGPTENAQLASTQQKIAQLAAALESAKNAAVSRDQN